MKILVVDDETAISTLIQKLLEQMGHVVSTVRTGSEALTASIHGEFDLLITDLMLPDLQGTEIVRAIKVQSPQLPVIVISALNAAVWARPCEDAGATRFLSKPLDFEELRQEVRLVEKARLNLRIALVDPDAIHRVRLTKTLAALGCEVVPFATTGLARQQLETDRSASLIVVDADLDGADDLIRWGKDVGVVAFVFSSNDTSEREDKVMRAGAAFLLRKPVDTDALLTLANFLAG